MNNKQLQTEQVIFKKLLYTHRNAHKRSSYYQRLLAVQKYLVLMTTTQSKSINNVQQNNTATNNTATALKRFKYLVGTCDQLRLHAKKAAHLLAVQLGMSYHMPFALTMFATCGRFLAITKKLRSKWCENYKTMHSDIIGSTSKKSELYLFALNHVGPELIDPLEKDIVIKRKSKDDVVDVNKSSSSSTSTKTINNIPVTSLNKKTIHRSLLNDGDEGEVLKRASSSFGGVAVARKKQKKERIKERIIKDDRDDKGKNDNGKEEDTDDDDVKDDPSKKRKRKKDKKKEKRKKNKKKKKDHESKDFLSFGFDTGMNMNEDNAIDDIFG